MKKIIAEAGVAWHSIDEACEIIKKAAEVGCDAVKFQLYNESQVVQAEKRYQQHILARMLNKSEACELCKCGMENGITVFFTPMFIKAIEWCEELKVQCYKVRAKDAYNTEMLLKLRHTGKPVYVSRNNWKGIDPLKQPNFYTLYYDINRPTKYTDVFKGYSSLLRSDGYSCHCDKLYAVLQVMRFGGVDYIEVHCTLDPKDRTLPDHKFSFPFVDIFEMCKERDFHNSRNPNGFIKNRPKFELA